MSSSKNPTPVVIGLLHQDKKVLLGLRPHEKGNLNDLKNNQIGAGYWEFPGGKVEWGEVPTEALKRELQEELNIHAKIGALRLAQSHIYTSDRAVLLLFYDVCSWQGALKNLYHAQLKWVRPTELYHEEWLLPANKSFLPELVPILLNPLP